MKETKKNYINNDGLTVPAVLFFALIALVSFITLIYFGKYFEALIPLAIIILSFSSYRFTEIDFETRQYREGYTFFGNRFGEWKKIFDFNYVSIVGKNMKATHSRTLGPIRNPVGSTDNYGVYEIRLFKSISQRIILFQFSSHKKALIVGKLLAIGLESKLLDAAQVPAAFIEI